MAVIRGSSAPLATMSLMSLVSFEPSEISGGTEGHWGEAPVETMSFD